MNKPKNNPPDKNSAKKTIVAPSPSSNPFIFSRRNYFILLAGIGLLAIGFLLMMGGHQPPDQFDESEIYSFRRTTLSSITVVIGLIIVLYSIFAKHEGRLQSQR